MPDIEKRTEAFVRIAHGIIIFRAASAPPKSCCTCWVSLMNPENGEQVLPLI